MFARSILLVSCLVSATAAAQVSATPAETTPATSSATDTAATPAPVDNAAVEVEDVPTPNPPPVAIDPPPARATSRAASGPNAALSSTSTTKLVSPSYDTWPTHHDLESDPLFVPSTVLIGVGSAALLTSLFTGLGAHGIYKTLERDCSGNVCPNGSQSKIDNGQTLAVVSTVLTGVGIGAVAAGVVMLVIANGRTDEAPPLGSAGLRLSPGPTPLGLGAAANF
jgi:hypothetical protein